jgi:hypothetical protein
MSIYNDDETYDYLSDSNTDYDSDTSMDRCFHNDCTCGEFPCIETKINNTSCLLSESKPQIENSRFITPFNDNNEETSLTWHFLKENKENKENKRNENDIESVHNIDLDVKNTMWSPPNVEECITLNKKCEICNRTLHISEFYSTSDNKMCNNCSVPETMEEQKVIYSTERIGEPACRYYLRGVCRRGKYCTSYHPPMGTILLDSLPIRNVNKYLSMTKRDEFSDKKIFWDIRENNILFWGKKEEVDTFIDAFRNRCSQLAISQKKQAKNTTLEFRYKVKVSSTGELTKLGYPDELKGVIKKKIISVIQYAHANVIQQARNHVSSIMRKPQLSKSLTVKLEKKLGLNNTVYLSKTRTTEQNKILQDMLIASYYRNHPTIYMKYDTVVDAKQAQLIENILSS